MIQLKTIPTTLDKKGSILFDEKKELEKLKEQYPTKKISGLKVKEVNHENTTIEFTLTEKRPKRKRIRYAGFSGSRNNLS